MANIHATAHDLIQSVERKDRRFRLFQTLSILFLAAGIIALLLINYHIQSQNHVLLSTGVQTLNKQKEIIDQQKQTIDVLSGKITDLQNHVDCLFDLATQPNPQTSHISDASTCTIISSSGGATSSSKSEPVMSSPSTPVAQSPTPVSSPAQPTPPTPSPKHPLVCTLTLTLLGCK